MSALKTRLTTTAVSKHIRDASISSTLADDLREQYGRRSVRVIKGDTVKVMRGEYTGIEGKVEKVNTTRGTLSIEGVQREKVKGGNVKVQIHASNVRLSGLNLDDKYRQKNVVERNQQQGAKKDETTDSHDNENEQKSIKTPTKKAVAKRTTRNKKIKKNITKEKELNEKTTKKNTINTKKKQLNKEESG